MVNPQPNGRGGQDEHATSSTEELPDHLALQREYIVFGDDMVCYTHSSLADMQFNPNGQLLHFEMEAFRRGLDIEIKYYNDMEMGFVLRGVSYSIANALRRVMIAEVPTISIEHVFIAQNTSVLNDETLSHRLGLVPLAVDPRLFQYKLSDDAPSEDNTIVYKLHIECKRLPDGSLVNDKVYAKHLEWLPEGSEMASETGCWFNSSQRDRLKEAKVSYGDILLAKLRPGQVIELEAHCVKGVGSDHAKFSPVATAWYQLMPEVALLKPVSGPDATELAAELPGLVTVSSSGEAVVGDALEHELLLEKVRRMSSEPRWAGVLQLRRHKHSYFFTIQSTGGWKPHEIFQQAIKIIKSKCDKVLEGLQTVFPDDDALPMIE